MTDATGPAPKPKAENLWLNLICNVAIPTLILSKLSAPDRLGPKVALLTALAFPLAYGLYDLAKRRNFNFLAALGFASTLATGGLGLLKLQPFWFAVKEAVVPSLIALAVLVSHWVGRPLVRSMLLNEQVIDLPKVKTAVEARQAQGAFDALLGGSSWLLAVSFLLSAVLNFALARYLIHSQPNTPEFNAELGRMTLWSWPVIVVPSMAMMMFALWRLLKGLEQLTGLTFDEIMKQPASATPATGEAAAPSASTSTAENPDQASR